MTKPLMCLEGPYFPTEDMVTSSAMSSQVGIMNPHNVYLMGRK